jgi:hypothetical protein
MLRASLGKVVHTVKRAGNAAKDPPQALHKIAVRERVNWLHHPSPVSLQRQALGLYGEKKDSEGVRKVDIPAVIAGEGELEPIKTTAEKRGPATQREDRIRGQ